MKYIIHILIFVMVLTASNVFALNSYPPKHNLLRMPLSPKNALIYDAIILPWIKAELRKNISDGPVDIRRNLISCELYRYELVEGKHRYSVHIEYGVRLSNKSSKTEKASVMGQEIIFLMEDNEVIDYFPFNEYVMDFSLQ